MKSLLPDPACLLVFSLLAPQPAAALTINLDWDTSSVFYNDTTARAAIQAAADDISDAITSSLTTVNQPTFSNPDVGGLQQYRWDRNSSTLNNQTLSSTYGWNFRYTTTSGTVEILAETLSSNEVKLFVRGEALGGNTLGVGGSAAIRFSADYGISFVGGINQSNLQTQFEQVVSWHSGQANSEYDRNSGPVISTIAGVTNINFGNGNTASAPYSVSYGPTFGSLALDTSWGSETFNEYWHTDHTIDVASGKNDLYSVALHEMVHAIGLGSSETWESFVSGTTWSGPEVIAEYGTGANMVVIGPGSDSPIADHIASGRTGQSLFNGATQEAALDPTITSGTRKYLTTLDLAFLRDLGYQTITPVFGLQGDFNDDGLVNIADYTVWRDNLGAANEMAISNNGDRSGGVTAADYTVWKDNFGQSSGSLAGLGASVRVPEPGGLFVAAICSVVLLFSANVSRIRAAAIR